MHDMPPRHLREASLSGSCFWLSSFGADPGLSYVMDNINKTRIKPGLQWLLFQQRRQDRLCQVPRPARRPFAEPVTFPAQLEGFTEHVRRALAPTWVVRMHGARTHKMEPTNPNANTSSKIDTQTIFGTLVDCWKTLAEKKGTPFQLRRRRFRWWTPMGSEG